MHLGEQDCVFVASVLLYLEVFDSSIFWCLHTTLPSSWKSRIRKQYEVIQLQKEESVYVCLAVKTGLKRYRE